ncbi:hypothetical protein QTP88_026422 [Uroleucon formosanum]
MPPAHSNGMPTPSGSTNRQPSSGPDVDEDGGPNRGFGPQVSAVGSEQAGSRGSSPNDRRTPGVDSQALDSLNATSAETAVSSGTRASQVVGDKKAIATDIKGSNNKSVCSQKRTIDIGALSEEALLDLLRGYINSMCAIAQSNRNVHKELKETLANSSRLMSQDSKVVKKPENKNTRPRTQEIAQTQTKVVDGTSNAAHTPDASSLGPEINVLKEIKSISARLSEQGEKIDAITSKLSAEDQEPGTWAVVARKKKNNNNKVDSRPTSEEAARTKGSKMAVGRSSARTRTPAILVDVVKENFPALAQRIRGGVNKGVIGNHVTSMRQAKSGG